VTPMLACQQITILGIAGGCAAQHTPSLESWVSTEGRHTAVRKRYWRQSVNQCVEKDNVPAANANIQGRMTFNYIGDPNSSDVGRELSRSRSH